MPRLVLLSAVALLIIGCTGNLSEPPSSSTTSAAVKITTTATEPPVSTTTEAFENTTVTWQQERVFHMEWGPVDGQYTVSDVPGSLGGVVPEAVVTLNGTPTPVEYCGNWLRWANVFCWGFGYTEEGIADVALEEGPNTLLYQALFDDGETMQHQPTIQYDPTLTTAEGWIVDVEGGEPPIATIDFVDLEFGEADGIDVIGKPRREAVVVADDAAFIILERNTPGNRPAAVIGFEEFVNLIEQEKAGQTLDHLFWGRLLVDDTRSQANVPCDFLLTADGELQQVEQWWSP